MVVAGERRLRVAAVMEKMGYKRTHLYQRIREGAFPAPRKEGKISYWLESELDTLIAATA